MGSCTQDFPFGIMNVVELLHLNVRRQYRQTGNAYLDCPFCNDRKGRMNVNFFKDVWRCNHCGEHGGMLSLYARLKNTTNSGAYQEICDALLTGDISWEPKEIKDRNMYTGNLTGKISADNRSGADMPQAECASPQEIHRTYSQLFGMLTLNAAHRAHLRSEKRGLMDEQIDRLGFKSTPPYFLCRSLTERLVRQGCKVAGVPGFYLHRGGYWTVKFSRRTAGILIPAVGMDGLIRGAQILLDVPMKDKDDPPEKAGAKYIWFSSSARNMGVSSGSPVHFIGNYPARTVYVTEGLLKADVAHCLLNRSFAAVAGANNVTGLEPLFAQLAQDGTERIVEAYDMDKYSNEMVARGSSRLHLLAKKYGMECRSLTWNPNYKGIDDWLLALQKERRKEEGKEQRESSAAFYQEKTGRAELGEGISGKPCGFRIYQLVFERGRDKVSFAFKGIRDLYKAGYEQPPASIYQLVCDAELVCPGVWGEKEILEQISAHYGKHAPENYKGRPLASSDVVELDSGIGRRFFYMDGRSFEPVRFSPFLAKPMEG